MKKDFSKKEAELLINDFFKKSDFSSEEVRKIKRLASKYKIRLKDKRRFFCKKCLSKLSGKTRVSKTHKTVTCENCDYKNNFKI